MAAIFKRAHLQNKNRSNTFLTREVFSNVSEGSLGRDYVLLSGAEPGDAHKGSPYFTLEKLTSGAPGREQVRAHGQHKRATLSACQRPIHRSTLLRTVIAASPVTYGQTQAKRCLPAHKHAYIYQVKAFSREESGARFDDDNTSPARNTIRRTSLVPRLCEP